ncbi:hypothetical protein [Hymenobacter convexus]|uniref:hypothetical protein n=1 Tax=Hymenobacter sp. CA1UV-4 TaxID=3063782 RepID=UPI0027129C53|nr:hypothetical protein [Hymenobacter sp. CA1UV-4]MDO7850739.1 hypothetical protein [Hymenobacter sp. CA1UV-4]
MSTHHNDQKTGEHPNERKAVGTPKADATPAGETTDQTEDQLEQDALDAGQRHPNRSHDKADLDKPAYGGGH